MRRATLIAVVALTLLSTAGCWVVPGQGPDRQAFNDLENVISVDNVDTMSLRWNTRLGIEHPDPPDPPVPVGGADVGGPVVSASGLVHASADISVHGVRPDTGEIVWTYGDDQVRFLPDVVSIGKVLLFTTEYGINQGNHSVDAGTGSAVPVPGVGYIGRVETARGDLVAATKLDFGPSAGEYLHRLSVVDTKTGTVRQSGWLQRLQSSPPMSRVTLGRSQIFYAGYGLLATTPGDATQGIALRALPLDGPNNCGTEHEPYFVCPQWVAPLDGSLPTSPVLSSDGSTVYVGTAGGNVYAVDAATGAVIWSAAVGSAVDAAPALAYGTLFVPTASGSLVALAAGGCGAATCAPSWSTPTGGALGVQPAVGGGVVFTGANDGVVSAFGAQGCASPPCAPLWTYATGSAITGAPAVTGGQLYVGTQANGLFAFGPADD